MISSYRFRPRATFKIVLAVLFCERGLDGSNGLGAENLKRKLTFRSGQEFIDCHQPVSSLRYTLCSDLPAVVSTPSAF
jgi:hypothetical protein